jgi:hypothetical protein
MGRGERGLFPDLGVAEFQGEEFLPPLITKEIPWKCLKCFRETR